MLRSASVWVVVLLCSAKSTWAQAKPSWVGKEGVITALYGADLRVGNQVRGRTTDLVCTIVEVRGDWVWIDCNDSQQGWVRADDVAPVDEARQRLLRMLKQDSTNSELWSRLALTWMLGGDFDMATSTYGTAIALSPQDPDNYNNRGLAWFEKKEYDIALIDHNQALRLRPNNPAYWHNAGRARMKKGEFDKAISNLNQAIRLSTVDQSGSLIARGNIWAMKGDRDKALHDYDEAIRLAPASPHGFNAKAWMLATNTNENLRDGKLALAAATRACELARWRDWSCLDTLSTAHAEAGDFEAAVRRSKEALAMAPRREQAKVRQRLELFEAGRPFRETD